MRVHLHGFPAFGVYHKLVAAPKCLVVVHGASERSVRQTSTPGRCRAGVFQYVNNGMPQIEGITVPVPSDSKILFHHKRQELDTQYYYMYHAYGIVYADWHSASHMIACSVCTRTQSCPARTYTCSIKLEPNYAELDIMGDPPRIARVAISYEQGVFQTHITGYGKRQQSAHYNLPHNSSRT